MIKTIFKFTTILLFSGMISCHSNNQTNDNSNISTEEEVIEEAIENQVYNEEVAHKKDAFLKHKAVSFNLNLTFGGKERLNGKITVLTNSTKALIEYKDGRKIYVDDNKVFCSPEMKENPKVRFDAYTWTYFFLLPYKLNDNGTHWETLGLDTLAEQLYYSKKLTFDNNIGDAPDDWYIVYSNQENHLIEHAAYIVTMGKSLEEAEQDPHSIQYSNYQNIDGIPLAHNWTFWGWRESEGLTKKLGEAELSNFQFLENIDGLFDVPEKYIQK